MADLRLLSRRTDRHSNTEGDMMSLMYSDVTANEGEAARALAVSTRRLSWLGWKRPCHLRKDTGNEEKETKPQVQRHQLTVDAQ